jgi:hypothetical protein
LLDYSALPYTEEQKKMPSHHRARNSSRAVRSLLLWWLSYRSSSRTNTCR